MQTYYSIADFRAHIGCGSVMSSWQNDIVAAHRLLCHAVHLDPSLPHHQLHLSRFLLLFGNGVTAPAAASGSPSAPTSAARTALHFTRCNLNPTVYRGSQMAVSDDALRLGSSSGLEDATQLAQRLEV